jgi:hypothetical protein
MDREASRRVAGLFSPRRRPLRERAGIVARVDSATRASPRGR